MFRTGQVRHSSVRVGPVCCSALRSFSALAYARVRSKGTTASPARPVAGDPTFAGWCRRGHVFTWPLNREDEVVILKEYIIARTHRARPDVTVATLAFVAVTLGAAVSGCGATGSSREGSERPPTAGAPATEEPTSAALVEEGQRVFRFETFGDEQLWTDSLPESSRRSISRVRPRRSRCSS